MGVLIWNAGSYSSWSCSRPSYDMVASALMTLTCPDCFWYEFHIPPFCLSPAIGQIVHCLGDVWAWHVEYEELCVSSRSRRVWGLPPRGGVCSGGVWVPSPSFSCSQETNVPGFLELITLSWFSSSGPCRMACAKVKLALNRSVLCTVQTC